MDSINCKIKSIWYRLHSQLVDLFPFVLVFILIFAFSINTLTSTYIGNTNANTSFIVSKNQIGDGPSEECFTNFSLNIFSTGISFLVCHLSFFFDDYVAFTHNLFSPSDTLYSSYQNELYLPMKRLAFILLPLSFLIAVAINILRAMIDFGSDIHVLRYIQELLFSLIILLILPAIGRFSIDLNNGISSYIISTITGGYTSQNGLASLISQNININEIAQQQFIPAVASNILWISFFIAMLFLVIFFIVRFIVIWLVFLVLPLLISLEFIPYMKGIKETIITKLCQFIIVQPVFLLGLGFFFIIMKEQMDSIAKFILAICSLITLGFIPSYISSVSGGKLMSLSTNDMKHFFHSVGQRIDIAIGWIEESLSKPYELPLEKPSKK